jgi:hypothetical protein
MKVVPKLRRIFSKTENAVSGPIETFVVLTCLHTCATVNVERINSFSDLLFTEGHLVEKAAESHRISTIVFTQE